MPILISKTYEIVTPESAMRGDVTESGFVFKEQEWTFRELVGRIKWGYNTPNCTHGVPDWLSTEPELDHRDGSYTTYTLHPGKDKQSLRYWEKACKVAGLVN